MFLIIEFVCGTHPSCLKVKGWVGGYIISFKPWISFLLTLTPWNLALCENIISSQDKKTKPENVQIHLMLYPLVITPPGVTDDAVTWHGTWEWSALTVAIIDWDNTLCDDNWEADVGNLYCGAQGPCPDRLLCKSEDQSWQAILKGFWSIFENIFSLDVVRAWFMRCYLEVLCNSDWGMCPGGD